MLRAPCHAALPSCSQGARGLSVLWRVTGVFTGTTTSPGWLSRQRSDRYAIRAGRNLPDKEFRYLRTVIVTAAVHRGFDSRPCRSEPLLLTFRHRAGVSPYTSCSTLQRPVFLLNSRLSRSCGPPARGGAPSPEVTGPVCRVPGQPITRAPENALPVYVCPFAVRAPCPLLRGFSRQCSYAAPASLGLASALGPVPGGFACPAASARPKGASIAPPASLPASPRRTIDGTAVAECSPRAHRLRLAAWP